MKQTTLLIASITFIVGILAGYFYGTLQGNKNYQSGYNQAMEHAEARLVERGIIPPSSGMPSGIEMPQQFYSGEVVSVTSTALTIRTLAQNPLAEDQEMAIALTPTTKVTLQTQKPFDVLDAEMRAWQEEMQGMDTMASSSEMDLATPPLPFEETAGTPADIQTGAFVDVVLDGNEATEVRILQSIVPEMPLI